MGWEIFLSPMLFASPPSGRHRENAKRVEMTQPATDEQIENLLQWIRHAETQLAAWRARDADWMFVEPEPNIIQNSILEDTESCILCGYLKELKIWTDPVLTTDRKKRGVCVDCWQIWNEHK